MAPNSVTSERFDKKGHSTGGVASCAWTWKMMMYPQQMQQLRTQRGEERDVFMEYPLTLRAADQLKDTRFTMDMTMASAVAAQVSLAITNRPVGAKETVTTPRVPGRPLKFLEMPKRS